jgi:hypothetical protein
MSLPSLVSGRIPRARSRTYGQVANALVSVTAGAGGPG